MKYQEIARRSPIGSPSRPEQLELSDHISQYTHRKSTNLLFGLMEVMFRRTIQIPPHFSLLPFTWPPPKSTKLTSVTAPAFLPLYLNAIHR